MGRLGRSRERLIELSDALQARGVDLVVLDQGIGTSTAVDGKRSYTVDCCARSAKGTVGQFN
ncbi:recombinase family protein [Nocardia brasiliensis]|uniref:recombinase family protein n=1 Tax=Nocardia brasiliensis TaxID=37326 RepID=UPI0024584AB9|nr:recombinase family protein [Nocardia brasiliensis]